MRREVLGAAVPRNDEPEQSREIEWPEVSPETLEVLRQEFEERLRATGRDYESNHPDRRRL